jgi:hypothetical protein
MFASPTDKTGTHSVFSAGTLLRVTVKQTLAKAEVS